VAARLWFDDERTVFFVLPDDLDPPEGALLLRTFEGQGRGFDRAAIAAYEVDREEAHRHLRAWLASGWGRTRGRLGALGEGLPEDLETLLGADPARVTEDPEAARQAMATLVGRTLTWVNQQDVPPEARQALGGLSGLLGALAQAIDDAVDEADDPADDEE
jgi:hypothetical protein